MKKILVTVLAALTVLAIAGCKGSDTNNTTKGSDTEQKTTEQAQAFDAAAVKASILEKVTFDKEVVELKAENALVEYSITDTNVKCLAYNAAPGTSADQLVIFEAPMKRRQRQRLRRRRHTYPIWRAFTRVTHPKKRQN